VHLPENFHFEQLHEAISLQRVRACVCVRVRASICTWIYIYIYVCVRVCVCACVRVHVCAYVYARACFCGREGKRKCACILCGFLRQAFHLAAQEQLKAYEALLAGMQREQDTLQAELKHARESHERTRE
jgi:ABC-type maltose transport system permease subunit